MAGLQLKVVALVLVVSLGVAGNASALGINCRGSGLCGSQRPHTMSEINTSVQGLNDGNTYGNGQHIVCDGSVCAFLQNISGTKTGAQIKVYIQELLSHGCQICGSVPTEPGNNVNTGELTVNYVS